MSSAAVIASANWAALNAILNQAQRLIVCPITVAATRAKVSTPGRASSNAGTQIASVREKFSFSVRWLTTTLNCSARAPAAANPTSARRSQRFQVPTSGNRIATAATAAATVTKIRSRAARGRSPKRFIVVLAYRRAVPSP